MKHFLIVVDLQKDFVDGALGSAEAQAIIPAAAKKIRSWQGDIIVTLDTHAPDYLSTSEGQKLPVPHCIRHTTGWELNDVIADALKEKAPTVVEKPTFGSVELPGILMKVAGGEPFSIELIGLCTDICVVSNAVLLKASFPEAPILVDASCCAGVSPATHLAALQTMQCCQIDIAHMPG